MSYWRTYYHLIWTTKNREPLLFGDRIAMLQQAIHVKARDLKAFTHGIGWMPDHVHVAISIPPSISVSECVHQLKGSSSRFLNTTPASSNLGWFGWQSEYGVLTFGERSLDSVVRYLENQHAHHLAGNLWMSFESLTDNESDRWGGSSVKKPG